MGMNNFKFKQERNWTVSFRRKVVKLLEKKASHHQIKINISLKSEAMCGGNNNSLTILTLVNFLYISDLMGFPNSPFQGSKG